MRVIEFGVLGAVAAWDGTGEPIALRGPRHRAVLARLLVARRRVVPVPLLVEDVWGGHPPEDAVGTLRTFVAALRRALEPERPRRTPSRLLVTEGPGYALRADADRVDAWRFERVLADAATLPPARAVTELTTALDLWRGPAYADFPEAPWARAERSRLTELRLTAVERRAEARIGLGAAAEAVPDLDAHLAEHPWREDAWHLLAVALYRSGRQADALSVLRRARRMLREHLGVEPGPRLNRTEQDILRHADHLDPGPTDTATQIWARATASYESMAGGRTRLESTAGLMRDLAVTGGGGLVAARRHREAAVVAAEQLGDPELTARVIGAYDVPAIWTRCDDSAQAARVVAAAERTLRDLAPDAHEASRARLLATIAIESRGVLVDDRPLRAAREAVRTARRLNDAPLLVFALNGLFMQTFERAGLAGRRDAIGAEITSVAAQHGLFTYEVLGHLIRLQSHCATADFTAADRYASAADTLAERHELPLVSVFTTWYRALRTATTEPLEAGEAAYREAAKSLDGAGMPGLEQGLLPLALLCLRVHHGAPVTADEHADWGPYEPWVRPLLLLGEGRDQDAVRLLRSVPEPPRDLLYEALWTLVARAAIQVDDQALMHRAYTALEPARGQLAGAASGLLTAGSVTDHLDALGLLRSQ
ncbi:AfsR/SARP family transcriptional regulator [Streptomyces sp. NPDC047072]|uniref:AfsR/SARP family transcriptional regulator n=1 Tax=Streptomyces sp. NPDC047072 TaxID=3154809 RepID=UPI0033E93937